MTKRTHIFQIKEENDEPEIKKEFLNNNEDDPDILTASILFKKPCKYLRNGVTPENNVEGNINKLLQDV